MYNGIGLPTPRGSGTNGHVSKNLAAIKRPKRRDWQPNPPKRPVVQPIKAELIEHERRRQVEVRCLELRDLLEEQKSPEGNIEEQVNALRVKLLAENKPFPKRKPMVKKESDETSKAQEEKNERARNAFGIPKNYISSQRKGKPSSGNSAAPTSFKDTTIKTSEDAKVSSKNVDRSRSKQKKSEKSRKRSRSSSSSSSDKERKTQKRDEKKNSYNHRREEATDVKMISRLRRY